MDYKETWNELKERLKRADYEIWKLVDSKTSDDEMQRVCRFTCTFNTTTKTNDTINVVCTSASCVEFT